MPSITTWNRLEPRSRSQDLRLGLEARVHDPLWMLTRQWQVGEFQGRDTGSPITTSVSTIVSPINRISVDGGAPRAYNVNAPIEVLVEQEAVRPIDPVIDMRQATEAGLYFMRILSRATTPEVTASLLPLYLERYQMPSSVSDGQVLALIVSNRVINGIALHADLVAAGSSLPALPAIPTDQQSVLLKATRDWLTWYGALFSEPIAPVAWSADRMEYSFAMGVAGDAGSYSAQEFDGGAVDWFTFDRSANPIPGAATPPPPQSKLVVSTPVTFRGMPARRFWEMEDAAANIGALSAAAEDIGRVLLREFALIYGNDWFQFPLCVPVGSEVQITALSVVDTFGIPTLIPPYRAVDSVGAGWRMFEQSLDAATTGSAADVTTSHPVLFTPGAVAPLNGEAIEEVLMLRDELANMAWGIERTVVGPSGMPLDRTTAWNIAQPVVPPPSADAEPQYRLGSNVPAYWLPFVPTSMATSMKLMPGKMPGPNTGPQGKLLSEVSGGFSMEEVPREGVLLHRRYRYARGLDGTPYLWIGRRRSTGKGEGQSGLRFDYLE